VADASAPAIAQICYRLDGMPLAIELAAARVRALAVEQIADRLDDRFTLLNAGSRAAPARHQTLRAMIDWSYGLLEPQEKTLFRRLAIFSGGWTLEAAEAVCAADEINATEVLSVLSQLVDKSLASVDRLIGQARYSFPETIRQYAREKLLESGEFQAVQDRHLDYFLQLAEKAESHLIGAEQVIWLKHLEREHDNLRTALECSLGEGRVEKGLRLAAALSQFWQMRGYLREGRARLEALLSRSSETSASRRASALLGAGFLSSYQDDVEQATASYEKALALYRDLDDKSGIAYSLVWLGWMAETQGDYTQARTFAKQSLTLYRELDSKWGVAMALFCLAEVAYLQGDFEQATALLRESLALCREIGNAWAAGRRLTRLGQVTHALGDPEHAIDLIRDGLNVCRQASDYTGIGWALAGLAGVAGAQGEVVWAVRLMGSVAAFWEETGAALWSLDRREYERNVAIARTQLDETTFATAWTEGQAMTLEETIAYALAERQISLPIKHSTPTTSSRTDKQRMGGLTAREREVAALIAQGKSNRDIAEALVLSERTIEGHVSNILNKLGFTARTQIAAWAVEKGLAKAEGT
jgi:non-specific serine/threonine protein kinase